MVYCREAQRSNTVKTSAHIFVARSSQKVTEDSEQDSFSAVARPASWLEKDMKVVMVYMFI